MSDLSSNPPVSPERDICDMCGETWKSDACCYWSSSIAEETHPRRVPAKEETPTDAERTEELIKALATAGGVRPFTEYAMADLRTHIEGIVQERDTLREHAQIDATMLENCRRERASLEIQQSSPASSPSASTEAMGVLVRVCQHMGAMFVEKGVPLPELKDGERDLSISAARSRLEQLYREQQQRLDEALTDFRTAAECARENFKDLESAEATVREQQQEIERTEEALEMFRAEQKRDKEAIQVLLAFY